MMIGGYAAGVIGGLGVGEMILIFAVLLLVFGAKRLPEIGGAMGKGIRDFKRSLNGLDDEAPSSLPRGEERREAPPAREPERTASETTRTDGEPPRTP